MQEKLTALLSQTVGATLLLTASSGLAHHSGAAQFDAEKPFTLVGTVTEVDWRNPHAYFYVDVEDDAGNVSNWGMELLSPNFLMRAGWTSTSLKAGDVVTVEGISARDGSNTGSAKTVTLNSTGEILFEGQRTAKGAADR